MSNKRITIIADDRETNGANPYFDSFITTNNSEYLKKSDKLGGGALKLCVKRITTGDYNVLLHVPGVSKPIVAMIVERKTWKDLSASLTDGRSKAQHAELIKMRDTMGCHIAYLIEGAITYSPARRIGRKPFKNLDAKVRHFQIRGIPVYRSKDQKHSAEILVNLARDMYRMYQSGDISFNKQINDLGTGSSTYVQIEGSEDPPLTLQSYLDELASLNAKYQNAFQEKGVSPVILKTVSKLIDEQNSDEDSNIVEQEDIDIDKIIDKAEETAEDYGLEDEVETLVDLGLLSVQAEETIIPKELTDRKIKTDSDLLMNMWLAIPQITDKSVVTLMKEYKLSDIIAANAAQTVSMTNKIKDMKYASGSSIGEKRAKKIMSIAYTGTAPTKKEKVIAYSVKILQEVPGITVATAKKILAKYSLRDICLHQVTSEDIADIYKTDKRKIGKKTAEKLIELLTS